ncbi:hypothetical protein ABIB62_004548 [Mucilaginibacter sp. UYP25]|jgi:hypothetical protein|uniref:hypothetical protein n=1 Tax=unclassified Mucilaginibacter TaxID=2617802 RepID=UPI003398E6E0
MTNQKDKTANPNFNSLGEIMGYFQQVPFEQFKSNLDEWFLKSLGEKGIDLENLNGNCTKNFPVDLQVLIKEIYERGESLQRKNEKD